MGVPDHFTCLLRNLYTVREATFRIEHGTMNRLKIGKGLHQNCILSPCSYAEYIIQNAGLDKSQAGIKTARKNINSLRNADDTTLMVESEEELKNLLIKVKEKSEKAGPNFNTQKIKIKASSPITP